MARILKTVAVPGTLLLVCGLYFLIDGQSVTGVNPNTTTTQFFSTQNSASVPGFTFQPFTNVWGLGFSGASDAVANTNIFANSVLADVFTPSALSMRTPSTWGHCWSSASANNAAFDTCTSRPAAGVVSADTTTIGNGAGTFKGTTVLLLSTVFASLGTPGNGTFAYCSDCTIANPCAGSGTGALAKRLNGVWVCN